MTDREIFKKNLAFYMDMNRRSQIDLAKYLGISKATVSCWLNGKAYPRIDKMQQIADFFGIRTDDLLTDSDMAVNALKVASQLQEDIDNIEHIYSRLNAEYRQKVRDYINILYTAQRAGMEDREL